MIAMVVSADTDYDSDVLAVTGGGCALALSEMPFQKTIAVSVLLRRHGERRCTT